MQEALQTVSRIVLRKNQFCVVVDPVDDEGRPQLGNFEVRQGVCSFFLHPGKLSQTLMDVIVNHMREILDH